MTTIAIKDGIMAADTLQLGCYIDQLEATKIHRHGDTLIAGAGDMAKVLTFIDWFTSGADKDSYPECLEKEFEALILDGDGESHYYGVLPVAIPCGRVAACGSGQGFAMGAMLAGKSAVDAVEIACKLDDCSALPVKYVDVTP